jgi:CheY-like chemotaxis protein/anti-sigma regulatory factor (Ser/Thr protein kinase)
MDLCILSMYSMAASPRTLLVVDDDPSIHELIGAMLAGKGWELDRAENGDDALAHLENRSYDLVLSDILMPGMDGLTLLGHIRNRYPEARIVVMTVKNTSAHILESLRHQATAYIAKPFDRDTLIVTLQNALSTTVDQDDIRVVSDKPNWISLQIRCKLATVERLTQFVRELPSDLKPEEREQIAIAFRELLMNAIEHGGRLDPGKIVSLSYIRTARSIVYYIRDPGQGFSMENLAHAAVANSPDDPLHHVELREQAGTRPGGFGLLLTQSFADELIYSARGNEVILIKYL